MTAPRKCPDCDSEIPEGTPGGMCPVCLLAGGGDTSVDDQTISGDGLHVSGKEPDTVETPAITEKPGSVLGPYKLLQQIGEGAFGVVFMAEQREPIKRKVALKIIKPGMDTREVIARFEAERQALAMMDHSNIAKVLDAGATDTGRPYFAMELVKGISVTEYCDTHCLDTNQRLDLFQDICSAIQHAHQKGIVHRDLKPSNILVELHDIKPVVKVIDFGVAKAINHELTEKTLFTAYGQMIGTPQYMSPEQSEMSGLDIDTRSDIYSLGVVLYELLTGKTPLDLKQLREAGMAEIHRLIREEEPVKPSTRISSLSNEENTAIAKARNEAPEKLNRLVSGDLDWIVMKALEKDRGRRYETATEFAADIENYMSDLPVLASPPSASYRLGKFARRNKAALTTVMLIFSIMLVGMVASIWQAVRATNAETAADAERELAKQSAEEATEAKNKAEQAAKESKAVLEFFETKVLAAARPKEQDGGLGIDATIYAAIEIAEPQISEAFADQPLIEASIRQTLGTTYSILGEHNAAILQYERVLELRKKEQGIEHPTTFDAMDDLVEAYHDMTREGESLALREKVFQLRKKVLGPEHKSTLVATHKLSYSYWIGGRYEESLALEIEVLELQKKLQKENRTLGKEKQKRWTTSRDFPSSENGVTDKLLKLAKKKLELSREVEGLTSYQTKSAMRYLLNAYRATGHNKEVLALQEEIVGLAKEGLDSTRKSKGSEHPDTLRLMKDLASLYRTADLDEEELASIKEIVDVTRKTKGREHRDTYKVLLSLASWYSESDHDAEALDTWKELLEISRKMNGLVDGEMVRTLERTAFYYQKAGRNEEAVTLLEESLGIRRKDAVYKSRLSWSMRSLAEAYKKVGRNDEALALTEESLELIRKEKGVKHRETRAIMNELAYAYQRAGRHKEEITLREEMLESVKEAMGAEHREVYYAMSSLASALEKAGRNEEAVALKKESQELVKKLVHASGSPHLTRLRDLAKSRWEAGRLQDAEILYREYITMLEEMGDDWAVILAQASLGSLLIEQKKYSEAELVLLAGYKGLETYASNNNLASYASKPMWLKPFIEHFTTLYKDWGKPEKAKEWQAKLDGLEDPKK